MQNPRISLFFVFVICLVCTVGCASFQKTSEEKSSSSVLLEWVDQRKELKPVSIESDQNKAEQTKDEIITDRPDFTEASTTVGKGRVQLEAGYTLTKDRSSGEKFISHSYPESLLRIGLFADWFELRLGQNISRQRTQLEDGTKLNMSGLNDFYVGTKLGLTVQKEWLPETALIIQATVPTGSRELSAGETLPGCNLLYGWAVVEDKISIGGSTQANRSLEEVLSASGNSSVQHGYLTFAQSVTVNYSLTEKMGAYTEVFAFFPHSAISSATKPQYYFDGGLTYKINPLFQWDIRAGVGLNKAASDFFAGCGFAVKY